MAATALAALAGLLVAPAARAGVSPVVALHAAKKHQPGKVTFLDPDTLAVIGTSEIKDTPLPLGVDASGSTLYVFGAPGSLPNSSIKGKHAWTVSSIDTTSYEATLIGEVGRPPFRYFTDDPPARLYIVGVKEKGKKFPITAFDLAARKPLGAIASVEKLSAVALSPDGAFLYALCQAIKHKKPKGPPGNLHVLDARTGAEIARHDVGPGASSVAFDPGRSLAYVLGVASEDGSGRVTVLRGGAIVARFDIPAPTLALVRGPDDRGFLLAEHAVIALAPDGLAVARAWRIDFDPSELLFDAERGRFFAGARAGSKIAELDLQGEEAPIEHATGRAGVKTGKEIGRSLVTAFAVGAAFFTGIPAVPAALWARHPVSMTFSQNGARLYVLNPFSNDISLYDPAIHDVVGFVPTGQGSFRLVSLEDDPNFWIEAYSRLVRLNTSTNEIDRTVALSASDFGAFFRRAVVAYDIQRGRAWILAKTTVTVVDLHTGEVAGVVELPSPAYRIWIHGSVFGTPAFPQP